MQGLNNIDYELIQNLKTTKFKKPVEYIQYGTAGFRTK